MRTKQHERRVLARSPVRRVIASMLGVGLGLAIAALLLFAWIAEEVPEGDTAAFDNATRGFVHGYSMPWLTFLMQGASFLGSTVFLTIGGVAVIVEFYRARRAHSALLFSVTMIGAVVLNFVLKISFARARPIPYFDTPLPSSYSFPSGHALFSMCFYGSLAWIWASHPIGNRKKVAGWIVAAIVIFGVGFSRIYLGVHYPSDVAAGYLAAFVWVFAVFGADSWFATQELNSEKH